MISAGGRASAVLLALLLLVDAGTAQRSLPLSYDAEGRNQRIESGDLWLAAGFAAGTVLLAPLDRSLARILQDSSRQDNQLFQIGAGAFRLLGFPGSVIIGTSMYAVGRLGDSPELAAFGLHSTEAIVLSYGFVWLGKNVLGRARPVVNIDNSFDFKLGRGFGGNDLYRSFPSGHTAAAFAIAAAVSAEADQIWPEGQPYLAPLLYTAAGFVGLSRMYNNRHWATDVIGGAAIGVFVGNKLIDYLYSHDSTIDRWLLPSSRAAARTRSAPATRSMPLVLVWRVPI